MRAGLFGARFALALLLGCSPPRDPCPLDASECPPPQTCQLSLNDAPPVMAGERAALTFAISPPCFTGGSVSARVEVRDPRNDATPADVNVTPPGPSSAGRLDVAFNSSAAGNYHLVIEVDQVRNQLSVAAMADRPSRALVELPQRCRVVEHTASGAFLCDGDLYRGTTHVQHLEGTAIAAGPVVWTHADGGVRRHLDTGNGLLAGGPSIALPLGEMALVGASETDLLLFGSSTLARVALDGGALYVAGMVTAYEMAREQRMRDGHRLAMASFAPISTAASPVCIRRFDVSAAPRSLGCTSFAGTGAGALERTLWMRANTGQTVTRFAFSGDALVPVSSFAVPDGWSLFPRGGGAPGAIPAFQQAPVWGLPVATSDGVVLERFEKDPAWTFAGANDALAWAHSGDGRTRVYAR